MNTNHYVVGILAHVDAGKTTLAESLLYHTGTIKTLGRVDHGDAFLDTYELEKARGITIFSKQAILSLPNKKITLLDTPGHVDFSAEMERTLSVLDAAILVINACDGVQGHVYTLWKLLEKQQIPTFIFFNKMDREGTDKEALLSEVREALSERCVDFSKQQSDDFAEQIALADETYLEAYLNGESVDDTSLISMIERRSIFPCFFGSALKEIGIDEFINSFDRYTKVPDYTDAFGAKVYKINRDSSGNRLTHLKITGGSLKVRDIIKGEDKVNQIRLYSGVSYETTDEAVAGQICAVTGLTDTVCGEALGEATEDAAMQLTPVLTYRVELPKDVDLHTAYMRLRLLEEEEPQLHLMWEKEKDEIHIQVMGEVQLDVLTQMAKSRFDMDISFGNGSIVYKETITDTVEGCGHYEPLRHYAEVRLLLEPGEAGSGITLATDCSEDVLDKNWQRLILTHLEEKVHRGVLTGSELTDVKITLLNGRAHNKHTEGGDFRQATYRAVRQGLMKAHSVLLEPVYAYVLEVPSEMIGRAMTDMKRMKGEFNEPMIHGDMAILEGSAPVVHMRDYPREVAAYTKGLGRISLRLNGYAPCHNEEEVIETIGYDAASDTENPVGSVFCSHGAGYYVPWDEVDAHMHTQAYQKERKMTQSTSSFSAMESIISEEELKEIFERTYGKRKEVRKTYKTRRVEAPTNYRSSKATNYVKKEQYLLVDGYNIIHAWEELRELAKVSFAGARDKLLDIMCNYQGFRKCTVIVVFDAYKVPGDTAISNYHNIHVVYTKEAETADQYIEKTVRTIAKDHLVTVATSDAIEQVIIMGQGALRMSAMGLYEEVCTVNKEIEEAILRMREENKNI